MSVTVLNYFGLQPVTDEETLSIIYGSSCPSEAEEILRKWLSLLPENIMAQIDAALQQERPFLPPDVTPEMMAAKNSKVPVMNQMEVLYRCVDWAIQAKEFKMAACISFVVDRASYWSGTSKALLQVVDLIKEASPDVAIAPQVQVRKARVLKDEGDLHGAMKVLDDVLVRPQGLPGEWKYVDDDQYVTTKAEIIKIKGHILHNMGLMKEAVGPFLESIRLFGSLQEKDDKGIASSLGLLTKCLGKLSLEEYDHVRQRFPDYFIKDQPCHESYVQGIEAVRYIQSLQESLYSSRHLLDADTSLLKYAILRPTISEEYSLFRTIMEEMKRSLSAHKTVDALRSSEQFFEFVRALFMISLTLAFCPVRQDRSSSEYLQQLSIELYRHLCNHNKDQQVARLGHSVRSIQLMNQALTILGLPCLEGIADEEKLEKLSQDEEVDIKKVLSEDSGLSESDVEALQGRNVEILSVAESDDRKETMASGTSSDRSGDDACTDRPAQRDTKGNISQGVSSSEVSSSSGNKSSSGSWQQDTSSAHATRGSNSTRNVSVEPGLSTSSSSGSEIHCVVGQSCCLKSSSSGQPPNESPSEQASSTNMSSEQRLSQTEPSAGPSNTQPVQTEKYKTEDSNKFKSSLKRELKQDRRGWTYSFGFDKRDHSVMKTQGCYTFPQMTKDKVLDPKKQWQTYKHKCVGLPVDPNFFASPIPSDENLYEFDADVSSSDEEDVQLVPLVNLSVPYIQQTVENKTKGSVKSIPTRNKSLVDQLATTEQSSVSDTQSSSRFFLHPHDLPNQPMRSRMDNNRCLQDDDFDGSEFAPLVDLAKTTMTDSLEEMRLGESISTTDPVEYINNWCPPVSDADGQGCEVQRAFLLTYNPATSDWTAQSTLAFVGEPLELAKGKKGHCREAFHVQFLHQDEPRGRYVGKRYLKRHARHHHPKRYMQDVVCQMMAGYHVIKFNEVMQNYKRDIQVQFLPAYHLQLLTPGGELEDCFNVEPYLHGDFIKLTNNLAFSNKKEHRGEELATALTHFSYCESKGALMIVDIQGWLPRESSGVIYLTDPQFHTSGMERFSSFDHQEKGMEKFWESVHPQCNDMCRAIGLERPNK